MSYRFIGKSLNRTEDARLLAGLGQYTSDFAPAGGCRLFVVRSPHAAARFGAIDTAAAMALPGVLLVLAPDDPELQSLGGFTSRVRRETPDGQSNFEPPYRALSSGRAQFAGDAVAAIFAETLDQAKDAAEALRVDWQVLPAVTQTRIAADVGAPQVWEEVPRNICFVQDVGDAAAVDAALTAAPHTVTFSYPVSRVIAAPMEPRAALATYSATEDLLTLYATLQNPHYIREEIADRILRIGGNRLRVVAPDVGGAFGMKESPFPEYVLALIGARRLKRPVQWVCDRSESFLADHHARDHYSTVTLGLDRDGTFLGLRIETTSNIGAYIAFNGLHTPVNNLGGLAGVYRRQPIHARITGVFTNTPPTSPYRGAGRPEATYAIERAIDLAAQRFGFDRVALRRKNMIAPGQMPYDTGFVYTYDSGTFERNMDDALALARWEEFPQRRDDARTRNRLAGRAVVNAIEIANGPAGNPFTESAEIQFDSTGTVTVSLGTHSQGQGHQITFAQIVADLLGLDIQDVKVRCGDTEHIEHGTGTFGSRSVVAGSVALKAVADRIIARGKLIAAAEFEAEAADIDFSAGIFNVAGTDLRMTMKDVARSSFKLSPRIIDGQQGLSDKKIASPDAATFPNACHVCEVEIDPDTGHCEIVKYCVVDDVGRVINPKLVKGQIHGGVVQGIGQILLENIAYDQEGQLISGSFMDYAMPRAADVSDIMCVNNEVLTKTNPFGVKGAGEAGVVGALAAVANAIVDALSPCGVEHVDMPATPERIWKAIQSGAARIRLDASTSR
jgi:carbon-monoxide dehydrogenase large subunit